MAFESSVSSSVPVTKYRVNDVARAGCAASASPARLNVFGSELVLARPPRREIRGAIGPVQHDLVLALLDRQGRVATVLLRKQHDDAGLGDAGREAGGEERRGQRALSCAPAGSCVLTANSVPLMSTANGVRTVIASGDCFAIRPETTASDPAESDVSKRPLPVVASNS